MVLIARASPKIMSDSDSIRDLEMRRVDETKSSVSPD